MSNLNLNKVVLAGRLTADIELKQTTAGVSVVTFSLAINRRRAVDKESQTDFINCQAWRQTAEFIAKYFKKGSAICVTGSIQTRSWTDKHGEKHYATEVVVDEAMFVDSRNEASVTAPDGFNIPDAYKPTAEDLARDDDLPF